MKDLFVYGTLMCEAIMHAVSGLRPSPQPATLHDYRRYAIKAEPYPAIIPQQGATVDGVVYRRIPSAAWQRLDDYEGELYSRQRVSVELAQGGVIEAESYVLRPVYSGLLDSKEWDFEAFLRQHKQHYVNTLK
jgi:gamma-glutamylcyclotransferase (GGCT)/AIG2-like uncharacterized protein YtfP